MKRLSPFCFVKRDRESLCNWYNKQVMASKDHCMYTVRNVSGYGLFERADLFYLFDKEKRAKVAAMRAYRSDYTPWRWWLLRLRVNKLVNKFPRAYGYDISMSLTREYIEINASRQEWWAWLNAT